jgi:lipid A 4'-phosphatase
MLYRLLIDPIRRSDARLETGLEGAGVRLHQASGKMFAEAGKSLALARNTLRDSARHLHSRIAAL